MAVVYIGIGSNIGDKEGNCREAVSRLVAEGKIKVESSSALYETLPEGGPPQENYINGVVGIRTSLSPTDCLEVVKRIEERMGRKSAGRNHPRLIDLDILLYDGEIIETEELTIPHPRMHRRIFVLKGLRQIAPEARHPVLNKTVRELYEECSS